MSIFRQLYYAIPPILRNRYAFTVFLFLAWLLFFDSNTIWSQWQMKQEIHDMQEKKMHYQQEITDVKKSLNDLLTNDATMERFAREKYLMKRENEDIFVISHEKK